MVKKDGSWNFAMFIVPNYSVFIQKGINIWKPRKPLLVFFILVLDYFNGRVSFEKWETAWLTKSQLKGMVIGKPNLHGRKKTVKIPHITILWYSLGSHSSPMLLLLLSHFCPEPMCCGNYFTNCFNSHPFSIFELWSSDLGCSGTTAFSVWIDL